METENIPQIVSMFISVGFAVWAAHHLITKTIPDLMLKHADEREKMMVEYSKSLDKSIAHCKEEIDIIVNNFIKGK